MDIAFMADKGGVGKTTLSFHAAARFAQLGWDVGLVDLDARQASATWASEWATPMFPVYPFHDLEGALPSHDLRIWDTVAHPTVKVRQLLAEGCDLVVVVAATDKESQVAAAELVSGLEAPAALVYNMIPPASRIGEEAVGLARQHGLPVLDRYVRRYSCFEHARWDGRVVCEYPYPSADKAWGDISGVVAAMLSRLEVSHESQAA